MNKTTAISEIIKGTSTQPIVFTTGYSCRIARYIADRPNHFYMTGSMGLSASIGAGIAMVTGSTVVVVDGDGSLIMNPGCLIPIGESPDLRLVHVVLDDLAYASTGGQATPAKRVDFVGWARSSGYPHTTRADSVDEFGEIFHKALSRPSPTFIHAVMTAQRT